MKEVFSVGDIVLCQNHNYTGIVVAFDEEPHQTWIDAQSKKFIFDENSQFLEVFPLDGGAVTLSSETTKLLRKATLNDFQIAYEGANIFAKQKLLKIFLNLDLEWREIC